eukprot:3329511-Pleurochrysis_carterae.AAC.3
MAKYTRTSFAWRTILRQSRRARRVEITEAARCTARPTPGASGTGRPRSSSWRRRASSNPRSTRATSSKSTTTAIAVIWYYIRRRLLDGRYRQRGGRQRPPRLPRAIQVDCARQAEAVCGMKIDMRDDGGIELSASAYVKAKAEYFLPKPLAEYPIYETPPTTQRVKDCEIAARKEHTIGTQLQKRYQSKVAALIYATPCGQPGEAYAYMARRTPTMALNSRSTATGSLSPCYSDSDWAVVHSTTAGFCITRTAARRTHNFKASALHLALDVNRSRDRDGVANCGRGHLPARTAQGDGARGSTRAPNVREELGRR